jgi:hypothetical protein
MARKSILNNYYIFDPANRRVVIPGGITREKLVLITNVTDNKVIYNFSDPELTATNYEIRTDIRNVTTTRVTLAYDTTSMSSTDKLQIVYDDFEETIQPSEAYHDAVNKMRVSTPQSQMDTDFEYGTQSTKWEGLAMINNNPFAYKGDDPLAVTDIQVTTNSKTVTVSVNTLQTALPTAGSAIFVQDTDFPGANGVYIVDAVQSAQSTFTYTAAYPWTAGNGGIYDASRTAIYVGVQYSNSEIGGTITLAAGTGTMTGAVQVDCSNVHGLEVGNEIAVTGSAGTNVNGSWVVARVQSPTRFFYFPDAAPSGSINTGTKKLYPRPQGNSIHRAFDGGVKFSTNTFSKNQTAIRQTKRYFRYQSGKGVAFSTGSILAPAVENIDSITASGNTVTVVCAVAHNLTRDTIVDVRGVNDNNYNGQFQVSNVIDPYSFQYTATSTPQESTAAGNYTVSPINSFGCKLEIGMMDQQNGIFFRYANGHLSVVRRSSTYQLSGKVTVTTGSSLVSSYTTPNGQGTKFSRQLTPGDYVVIRGSSYRVDGIISDTQMVIFPDYRGPSASNVPVSKTQEVEWFQDEWNIDRCDGTGKSGYDLDVTRMQMFYMDYSWYGAGFIRWGFRATDGNVIYAHKIPNNNFNTEAYMRSGNLPARYEVNTFPPFVKATKSIGSSDTTIYTDKSLYSFPESGTLRVKQTTSSTAGVIEYINYTGVSSFQQDITSVDGAGNTLTVASTTGLTPGGIQTITFDRPFSNIVAEKTYYVASVPSSTTFTITTVAGSSTPISLTTANGSALSPLAVAESGSFTGVTREQAGATGVNLTIASGSSTGTVSSGTGIQKGQIVVGPNIPDDTFVHSISGTNIVLSKAVTAANPTGVVFSPLGAGAAQTFTFSATQPTTLELLRATSVPTISHWGSSVIMEGRYDDDRAYVYTVGSRTQRSISGGATRAIIALRVAPSVDNSTPGNFGTRELINRMQLVLRQVDISSTGKFFVELVLNPRPDANNNWSNVGGTSLAQYSILSTNTDLIGGEVIYGFYSDNGVNSYDLSAVKEISNCILGGGGTSYSTSTAPNPTGIFPDGPEVLAVRVTNLDGTNRNIDARFSWTEAQA